MKLTRENVQLAIIVVLFAALVVFGIRGIVTADTTRSALCTLRAGYTDEINSRVKRIPQERRFVRQHPHGALGFTHQRLVEIQKDNERDLTILRTRRRALRILDC